LAFKRAGYEELPARLSRNNGFDGVFVKFDADRNPIKIFISESKFSSTGSFPLNETKNMGRQMSKQWIDANIRKMLAHGDPDTMKTAMMLQRHSEVVKLKANALSSNGVIAGT